MLVPHPATVQIGVDAIRAGIALDLDGVVTIRFVLSGNLELLRIPETAAVSRGERLWQHTCFEAFIRGDDAPGYFEFNFSPARQWAAYAFRAYREPGAAWVGRLPEIQVKQGDDRLELVARLPLEASSPVCHAKRLGIALSAVIETRTGTLGYWALRHPAAKPDFHHPDGFALIVDLTDSGDSR